MRYLSRGLLAALALLFVAGLTLAPQMFVGPARAAFLDWANAVEIPPFAGAAYPQAERLMNTALFVPLGAAVALILPRRVWPLALLAGLGVSAVVEYAQASIPGRIPDPADVLWNTVGGALGVIAVTVVRAVAGAVRPQRGSVTRT
jgi:glycopeptide antibiotics resistance protein